MANDDKYNIIIKLETINKRHQVSVKEIIYCILRINLRYSDGVVKV